MTYATFTYTALPFSSKNYSKNERKCQDGELPCAICGKPCNTETAKQWGIVIDGGGNWGTAESPEDGGHMGMFPVGNDCHKKYQVK